MAEIETAIHARITAVSALTAELSSAGAFYADLAPADEDKPYLVYRVVDDDKMVRTMGTDTAPNEALVQFDIIGDTFAQVKTIWIQLKAAFDRYRGTSGSVVIQDALVEHRTDIYDESDRDYQRTVDITFFYED